MAPAGSARKGLTEPSGRYKFRRMNASDRKHAILAAAGRVVLERGAAGLTLEAVAEAAGLSKGGLLHHYGSKDALLGAMVERLIEVTETRVAHRRARDPGRGGWTRAYLSACSTPGEATEDSIGRLDIAVLAAGANDPGLLEPLRRHQGTWSGHLRDDGIDPATAAIVRLAADGLWMNDLFALPVLDGDERAAVLARLEGMTHP